jgi:methoxymalonate biosynthesis acyl carrier protein
VNQHKLRIREFFGRFFSTQGLHDSDDIFAGGYINSLFAMQLIAWLEKDFDIAIEDADLNIANFNTVDAIAALIERKLVAPAVA